MKNNEMFYGWLFLLISIIVVLMFAPFQAQAEEHLFTGAWSKHINYEADNETHHFLGYEKDKIMIGGFINSHNRKTVAVVHRTYRYNKGYLELYVYTGLTYGYTRCYGDDDSNTDFCPALIPAISFTKYKVQPSLLVLGNAIALTFRWEI